MFSINAPAHILSEVQVNCILDFSCFIFIFILHRNKELHALNIYGALMEVIGLMIKLF